MTFSPGILPCPPGGLGSQSWIEARISSVISNRTGRPVFFWMNTRVERCGCALNRLGKMTLPSISEQVEL
jgi:hypothetical protein